MTSGSAALAEPKQHQQATQRDKAIISTHVNKFCTQPNGNMTALNDTILGQ
jgi:hypothetical protein